MSVAKKIWVGVKRFILNFVGETDAEGTVLVFSTKKIWFQVLSFNALFVPLKLLDNNLITGEQWLDFNKIIVPAIIAAYTWAKTKSVVNVSGFLDTLKPGEKRDEKSTEQGPENFGS